MSLFHSTMLLSVLILNASFADEIKKPNTDNNTKTALTQENTLAQIENLEKSSCEIAGSIEQYIKDAKELQKELEEKSKNKISDIEILNDESKKLTTTINEKIKTYKSADTQQIEKSLTKLASLQEQFAAQVPLVFQLTQNQGETKPISDAYEDFIDVLDPFRFGLKSLPLDRLIDTSIENREINLLIYLYQNGQISPNNELVLKKPVWMENFIKKIKDLENPSFEHFYIGPITNTYPDYLAPLSTEGFKFFKIQLDKAECDWDTWIGNFTLKSIKLNGLQTLQEISDKFDNALKEFIKSYPGALEIVSLQQTQAALHPKINQTAIENNYILKEISELKNTIELMNVCKSTIQKEGEFLSTLNTDSPNVNDALSQKQKSIKSMETEAERLKKLTDRINKADTH